MLGPPASLVTAGPKARSQRGLRVRAPRAPSPSSAPPGAEGRKLHPQARALPPSPAIPVRDAVLVRHHARPGFAKRPPRASPARAVPGAKATASPGLSHADSRCTPSASRLACRASVAKFRSRPVSSGFLPSLTFPLGRALGDGDVEGTRRRPPRAPGATRREGCSPETLRARLLLPSSASGQSRQGSASRGAGRCPGPQPPRLIRRPARSRAPPRPPAAPAINTAAIIKQTLTWAGGC